MAYQEPVQVQISLNTTPIQRASFSTIIFVGAHNYFTERVRTYSSISGIGEDFPTTSNEYIAANNSFNQQIAPALFKIGRRETDLVTLTPNAVTAIGQIFSITVTGTDNVTITSSFTTATGSEVATDIVTALIAGLSGVTGVTVGGTTTLTLAKSGVDAFSIADPLKMDIVTTTTENAADLVQAIEEVDNEWYFLDADDNSDAFVDAMASAIESRDKQYHYTTADTDALSGAPVPADDPLSLLQDSNYLRSFGYFHDEASSIFPETGYLTKWSVEDGGKAIAALNPIAGSGGAARNPEGNLLTVSQKTALVDRNGSFAETFGGQVVINGQGVKSASGEWADVVRNMDILTARIQEAFQFFMINRKIVSFTQPDIDALESVLDSTLATYVTTAGSPNILDSENPYVIRFPKSKDISALTKSTRCFTGEFDAYLAGAIQLVKITGTLSYNG